MAQHRKPEIRETICDAALRVFAAGDYASATMADIAKEAGVSIGNIYLYFENKERLFRAVIPDEFVAALTKLSVRKVRALDGVRDVDSLPPEAPHRVLSEEVLKFWIDNRLRVIVLLARAKGTPHEDFAARSIERLVRLATAYLATIRPEARVDATTRFVLRELYRNFVGAMVGVLARFEDETTIRQGAELVSAYHLAGLQRLFEAAPPARSKGVGP